LVVSELFWPEGGGAELATYLILQILANHGFELTVVTGTKQPAKIPGVKYHITPFLKPTNRVVLWTQMKTMAASSHFRRLLEGHDILYIPSAAYPLVPLAKKAGLRIIVHFHNYMPIRYHGIKYYFEPDIVTPYNELTQAIMHEYHIRKNLSRTLLSPVSYALYILSKDLIKQADTIICVSKRQAELIVKNMPQIRNKIKVIYNPPPPQLLTEEPKKVFADVPTFLYVGGDSYVKGFYLVIHIIRLLAKQNIKAKFILTNNRSQKSIQLLEAVSRIGSVEVEVKGRIDYAELLTLQRRAWALLFPSIWEEPLPYAVVEAMLSATVPIGFKMGGLRELLEDTPAEDFLAMPGQVEQLMSSITRLMAHLREDIANIGLTLRKRALQIFNIKRLKERILKTFHVDESPIN